ncbi:MAG: ATP phosphoribosyltransferase [Lentisphaerae bacterium]|nr:ATP phosphoribosyltransferase [Lentisphaerota bacterium]
MLQIAVPNKGALSDDAVALIREAGYRCRRSDRELRVTDRENAVEFTFLRPRDIAVYVGAGVLDLGITGRDLARDSGAEVVELLALGFGRAAFRYAVPNDSALTPEQFGGLRVATSYPTLVAADLAARGVAATVVRLDGAVEISVQLGVADVIADVVESGETLRQAGLRIVGEPLLQSEAVLLSRLPLAEMPPEAQTFVRRLEGIIVARDYVMVEYDTPQDLLEAACKVTPGLESPTVAPLSQTGWVAVKAMTRRSEVNRIMDRLHALGARGIIVTDIRTCRL